MEKEGEKSHFEQISRILKEARVVHRSIEVLGGSDAVDKQGGFEIEVKNEAGFVLCVMFFDSLGNLEAID